MIFKWLFIILSITFLVPATATDRAGKNHTLPVKSQFVEVVIETSLGTFTLELDRGKAPGTVANFLAYVDAGFYRNTLFHRVIPGFVVQGGGFEQGMLKKDTRSPVENESDNGLKNIRGTISMARRTHPDTATSQFFINLVDNTKLDWKADYQPGYTVFGKVTEGMDVIDKIAALPTQTVDKFRDKPKENVLVLSASRKQATITVDGPAGPDTSEISDRFIEGEHYVVLDRPVPTRDKSKVEVVEMFSYGCPHCYEFEPLIWEWDRQQDADVDFRVFPAVWNEAMKLYAHAFYAARDLNVAEIVHQPLFTAIVIEQRKIGSEAELADFFAHYGIDRDAFARAFHSEWVTENVRHAEERVRLYKPAGVPEMVVNGKYRVDRMRAGGLPEMLAVIDYLVEKERGILNKTNPGP